LTKPPSSASLAAEISAKGHRGHTLRSEFFESTRGRIVTLLRRSGFTVEELTRELGLTNNGVRANLTTFEHDGIVQQRGLVRHESGGGKPAYVYELTPEAGDLFPKAYEPVLHRLLDVLAERLGVDESEALLRVVGHLTAKGKALPSHGPRERLEAAAEVLNELGGLAELKEQDGAYVIWGYSCPLAGVTPDHPEVCRMVEALITELAGVPVYEHCDRDARPRCCFEVAAPGAS
jgi:DeoR family suf operon transcriptional repressor